MKKEVIKTISDAGIVEWFKIGEYTRVHTTLEDLKKIGFTRLRTGISWADWHQQGSEEWYDWLFEAIGSSGIELLPCFLYTPPSLGESPKVSSPPINLKSYADFIDIMITRYGHYFEWLELWNEPNNILEYDYTLDYSWHKFTEMIKNAAFWAKQRGKKTVLGGLSPVDPNWLQMMANRGLLNYIDAVGIHGFPDVFDQQWTSWKDKINTIQNVLDKNHLNIEIWISEAGFSTWQHDEVKQWQEFKKVMQYHNGRVYWYGLTDLHPEHATVGGFHLDEREYFFGMKKHDGTPKLLYRLLVRDGLSSIYLSYPISKQYKIEDREKYILITGGAGFIGTNLATRLLSEGKKVMIYDNLSRDGVIRNLEWLKEEYKERLIIQIADILEYKVLAECIKNAEQVFHLSAQVAVTSSVTNPQYDFEVNIRGTLNVLEAIRESAHKPPLIFTSTNKVYGELSNLSLQKHKARYQPESFVFETNGVDESQPLNFHSPYGCSKGAADQYVLDYVRCFGLRAVVFRMSCIYGPHQCGNEDQGWVAHFIIRSLEDKELIIYGDGRQVRDILFVEDLISAFLLAQENIHHLSGAAFNIGGGNKNTVSLLELIGLIEDKTGKKPKVLFKNWRIGDQRYYVSNTNAFSELTGWKPRYSVRRGFEKMLSWLCKTRSFSLSSKKIVPNIVQL